MSAGLRFHEQRAEPARCWVRYRPRRWPGSESAWHDLARGRLGAGGGGAGGLQPTAAELERLDDLVYLPPVAAGLEEERRRLCRRLVERSLPVLAQELPGAAPPTGAVVVWDLLAALLAGELGALAALPAGATAVWPLVAGITDRPELCDAGLARLAGAGAERVLPLVPQLEPRHKRRLAGDDEAAFDRLFHGGAPSPREFAARAAAVGLGVRFDRPLPAARPRLANLRVAARLAQIAELCLQLGRPEGPAQELYRAARWIETSDRDVAALAREGNLGVLSWLPAAVRGQVEAALAEDPPALLMELEAEYVAPRKGAPAS